MSSPPPLQLDLAARTTTLDGRDIYLAAKCFDVLAYLGSRAGTAVSFGQLLRDIWQDPAASVNTLQSHISQIRVALGDDAAAPRYIVTVRSFGYRVPVGMVQVRNLVSMQHLVDPLHTEIAALIERRARELADQCEAGLVVSREELDVAQAAIARVRELHKPEEPPPGQQWVSGGRVAKCAGCDTGNPFESPDWPCDTIQALDHTPRSRP